MAQPNNNNNNNGDDDQKYKKIFVGGLAWIVTTDILRRYFQENYGEVVDANVVSESLPGGNLKSKGYGFVTFRDVESANKACEHPPPMIEGRRTTVNLAYRRVKNNANQSNQTGLLNTFTNLKIAGSFNQMAWHPYQNGWFHQGAWHQYPLFNAFPHFPQGYWDSHYGAYRYINGVSHHPCPYTVTNSVRPAGVSQPPRGPRFEEITDPNPEAVSTADAVSNVNNVEDTETGSDGDQQMGKDQEGEISSGQESGAEQDVKDEQEKIVSGEDDDTKHGAGVTDQLCLTIQTETSENTPQENGLDHEEKTRHMEVGLTTNNNAYE
ncbi:unnamed protein product [Eruca vesicaria subsp. sativa]|uniref:RRM domain-containing protein n=1 Tax=Eruca vesicaria subsp. sativa TaxID=29727 RepID=A0ABC8KLL9_ERUVS|nr:unnamed protein product [Eruca vesicaria subsp. sativa]